GKRELGTDRARETEPERRHVTPAEMAARDLRLVHRAGLIPRVARIGGDERALGVEHLHQITEHPIGIDRRLVRFHPRPELREERFLALPDLLDELRVLLRATRRQLGNERLYGQLRVADAGVTSLVPR